MAALTDVSFDLPFQGNLGAWLREGPVAAGTEVFRYGFLSWDVAAGGLVPMTNLGVVSPFACMSVDHRDNSAGARGDLRARYIGRGAVTIANLANPRTATDEGRPAYCPNDNPQDVRTSAVGAAVRVGWILEVLDARTITIELDGIRGA